MKRQDSCIDEFEVSVLSVPPLCSNARSDPPRHTLNAFVDIAPIQLVPRLLNSVLILLYSPSALPLPNKVWVVLGEVGLQYCLDVLDWI